MLIYSTAGFDAVYNLDFKMPMSLGTGLIKGVQGMKYTASVTVPSCHSPSAQSHTLWLGRVAYLPKVTLWEPFNCLRYFWK